LGKRKEPARPSFLRRNWRRARFVASGPIASIGVTEISGGARMIDGLLRLLRAGPPPDTRIKTMDGGSIDLEATAFSYGIKVEELEKRLEERRLQTARAAYATFGLGAISLLLWLYTALHMTISSARIFSAIEFLPFCALFFLLAFKSAWMNWQLRALRIGSAVAFLRTTEAFLPRC
jgi:hypothetical protein